MPVQFKWAQRPEEIYVTADVVDATDIAVNIEPKKLTFSCKVDDKELKGEIDLKGEVVPAESSWCNTKREVQIKLAKKIENDDDKEYWGNLVPKKLNNLKVDWAKWKDEDELNGTDDAVGDFGGMPGMPGGMPGMPGGMGGMGGMPGMPGGMGGMGGMPGMEGMDMAKLMEQMGGAGGMGGMPGMEAMMGGAGAPDSDDEEDAPKPEA